MNANATRITVRPVRSMSPATAPTEWFWSIVRGGYLIKSGIETTEGRAFAVAADAAMRMVEGA
jgi:hypothetical protein